MHNRITAALLSAFLLSGASYAQSEDLVKWKHATDIPEYKFDVEVAGIKLGIPLSRAREILKKEFPDVELREDTINYGTNTVRAEPYVNFLSGDMKGQGEITLAIGSPVVGSVVEEITREVSYKKEQDAPDARDIVSSLFEKYGDPFTDKKYDGKLEMTWYYGDNCKRVEKPTGREYISSRCPVVLNARIEFDNNIKLKNMRINLVDSEMRYQNSNKTGRFLKDYENSLPKEAVDAPKF